MTILFGAVSVFTAFIFSVWLGDTGIYLPLSVWTVFAFGNYCKVKNAIFPALLAATFSGLTYDRGIAGFMELFVPFLFWGIMISAGKKYVFGTVASWFPGMCTGSTAAFVLYFTRMISGGWKDGEEWLSFAANVLFCGIAGVFIMPVIMWLISFLARKLGIDIQKTEIRR